MPVRITSKKTFLPSTGAANIQFGLSARLPTAFAKDLARELERAEEEATRAIAHRLFEKTQRNIKEMRISDRGMLLRSGYIRKVPDENAWLVGYTAPYAWYVDLGTGPKAGHGHYSSPPPYEKIRDWVRRNLQAFGIRGFAKPQRSTPILAKPRFRRILRNGQVITIIKPPKANPRLTQEYRPLRRKDDEAIIDDTTRRIQLAIFKHGTSPKPFWRRALAETRVEARHLEDQAYMAATKRSLSRAFAKAWRSALRSGLRVVGGRLKKW